MQIVSVYVIIITITSELIIFSENHFMHSYLLHVNKLSKDQTKDHQLFNKLFKQI